MFADENNKALDITPVYKSGVYSNDLFKLYDNEYEQMVDFYHKKRVSVDDVISVIYADLSKANEEIIKISSNGKNTQKILEFIDQNYFETTPSEYMFDDLDAFQMNTIHGFYLGVDAIFDSREDSRSELTSLDGSGCLLHPR